MKKFILPILLILLIVFSLWGGSGKVRAQGETITSCEQQEKILNLEECRFHTYAPPGALPDLCNPSAGCLWCAKKEEELLDFNLPPGGTHPFATRPISYTVEVD